MNGLFECISLNLVVEFSWTTLEVKLASIHIGDELFQGKKWA